ncbi:hypothetical protein BDW59DRAFT_27572 [Aspergillus cavernicola]|uniref:Zn(2)-C6 fungal-type domain-containing protein n=1 Tax=Aspergillus cavernicola TaxID=176166 RepID=A0ABR4HEL4_9EURO
MALTSGKHRKPTTHVKSGCRTCKIRRVKCDEQRPSCRKCVSSGRDCDGYGIWGPPHTQKLMPTQQTYSLIYPPQTLPGLAQDEKGYLHRFRGLLAGKLSSPFGSHFWSSVVHQLSLSEPAVVHASIALTSAYESLLMGGVALNGPFFLRQYNRAIRALTSNASLENPTSLRITVVSCVLFICIEILQGDLNAMQAHFSSGIQLLRQLQLQDRRSPTTTTTSNTILVKHDLESFDDHLVDVFTRLNLQFLMLGHGSQLKQTFAPSFQYDRRIHIPRYFHTDLEARKSLSNIVLAVIYLLKETERHTWSTTTTTTATTITTNDPPPPPSTAMLEKQQALQAATSEWISSYDHPNSPLTLISLPPHEKLRLVMLRIYADLATILLATCFSIKETAYDEHLSVFESIVNRYKVLPSVSASASLQENAIPKDHNTEYKYQHEHKHEPTNNNNKKTPIDNKNPFLTIDTAFFPPLYFTALKCRNQRIRRQALSLLQQYHHMEGPWTGPLLARVAGYVVDLEERNFEEALLKSSSLSSSPTTTEFEFTGIVVLPEYCRVQCVECHLPARRVRSQGGGGGGGGGSSNNIASLTLKRFRHELGKAGGWCVTRRLLDLA